jgi:AcrR family transcriptional regulator
MSAAPTAVPHPVRGGRGARDRILASARKLFYFNGIRDTGVEALAEHAHVSKRTLYQHFPSKDVLIAAYLRDIIDTGGSRPEKNLAADGAPRARLLSIFDIAGRGPFRGCPFHNAAVDAADDMPELAGAAAEAGLRDPVAVARRLAVLLEGATGLATSLGDTAPLRDARAIAELVVDAAR